MNENSIVLNKNLPIIKDGNGTLSSSYTNGKYINGNGTNGYNGNEDENFYGDSDSSIFVRVCINDQNVQKVLKFNLDDTVWNSKQKVLTTLAKELKDGYNYGFYMAPFQGRAGKFLDDSRFVREYSLQGPVAALDFKHKKRVYKFVKINQKEIKALNTKANLKRFLDYVRTNQVVKVSKLLEKGLDPNFHSDLGETPLTIAASLIEPRDMIMCLYNGGSHLDYRSRDTQTPMHKAAYLGNDKAINVLLELGAFPDVKDNKGLTPLYYAITNSSTIKCTELLLYNGSPFGIKDENNWQEVHHACKLGLSQQLDHLVYYGADVNAVNNSGNTALHICSIYNKENCARTLLFRGADKNIRNLSNKTAHDSAIIAGNQSIADLIEKHRDADVVPIRERPQVNLKRRSVFAMDSSASSTVNKYFYATMNSLSQMSSANSTSMTQLSSMNSISKLSYTSAMSNGTLKAAAPPPPLPLQSSSHTSPLKTINSGSSSPTNRSNSLSSLENENGYGTISSAQHVEYAYPRKRLYQSVPNRKFMCIKGYKPIQMGELELKKGDIVEILSIGEQGFWEGKISGESSGHAEGWFPAECVEEVHVTDDSSSNDSVLVKRKTLFNLISNNDVNTPRTVVIQRGKKGFGFVLRGAKTSETKFQPTSEVPALQFLEHVEKDSSADKAGLKPLDFLLEINGSDVTSSTHDECVKLIKKSGETLALKILTVNYSLKHKQFDSHSLASTSNSNNENISPNHHHQQLHNSSMNASTPTVYYVEGTKSYSHKQKPIPPRRDPATSLTPIHHATSNIINSLNGNSKKFVRQLSKSSTNLYFDDSNGYSDNDGDDEEGTSGNTGDTNGNGNMLLTNYRYTNSCLNLTTHNDDDEEEDGGGEAASLAIASLKRAKLKASKTASLCFSDNVSYMNCVLAQIDELDKTLAEYDTNSINSNGNDSTIRLQTNPTLAHDSVSLKNSLNLANDANAASIRTRLPVRKPGINDNFALMSSTSSGTNTPTTPKTPLTNGSLLYHQKTTSVPNLAAKQANGTVRSQAPTNRSSNETLMKNSESSNTLTFDSAENGNANGKNYEEPDIDYDLDDVDTGVTSQAHAPIIMQKSEPQKVFKSQKPPTPPPPHKTSVQAGTPPPPPPPPPPPVLSTFASTVQQMPAQNKRQSPLQTPLLTGKQQLEEKPTTPIVPKYGNNPLSDVKTELEKAIEIRLKKSVSNGVISNGQDNSVKQPQIYRLNVQKPVQQQSRDSVDSSPSALKVPPPPPPMSTIPVNSPHDDHLPPPPSPNALNRINVSSSPVTRPQSTRNSMSNVILPNQPQAQDPRSSSDFSEIIARKAREKLAKFHETKPTIHAVTYQVDGSKVYNQTKSNNVNNHENGNSSPSPTTTTPNVNKRPNGVNSQIYSISKTPNSAQNKPLIINCNPSAETNRESFLNTASRLLEQVKQQQNQN